jgi:hypothetical protein
MPTDDDIEKTILTDKNLKFSDENRVKIILYKITDLLSEIGVVNPPLDRLAVLSNGIRTVLVNVIGFGTEEDYSVLESLLWDIDKRILKYSKYNGQVSERDLIQLVLDVREAYKKFMVLYRLSGLGLTLRHGKENSEKTLRRALVER